MTNPHRKVLSLSETRIRHLTNELALTREEHEASMRNYFDIVSSLEDKVKE
jgi:hypothetical protein